MLSRLPVPRSGPNENSVTYIPVSNIGSSNSNTRVTRLDFGIQSCHSYGGALAIKVSCSDDRNDLVSCFDSLVKNDSSWVIMTCESNLSISSVWIISGTNVELTVCDEKVLSSKVTVNSFPISWLFKSQATLEHDHIEKGGVTFEIIVHVPTSFNFNGITFDRKYTVRPISSVTPVKWIGGVAFLVSPFIRALI